MCNVVLSFVFRGGDLGREARLAPLGYTKSLPILQIVEKVK